MYVLDLVMATRRFVGERTTSFISNINNNAALRTLRPTSPVRDSEMLGSIVFQ